MKERILIIDDSPSDIKVLSNVLRKEYTILVATNGADGLQLAVSQCPNLILLDIIMPGMDGFVVLEHLQKAVATQEIPVIFLTVVDAIDDKVRGFSGGAVDYIIKPFEALEVRARVQNHLGLVRARQALVYRNKELQEAAKLREEVERVYRHDLKNPLTAVLGNSELLLLAGDMPESTRLAVAAIHKAGLAMLHMINRYFDIFKIEQGLYKFKPHAVDLGQIAERVLRDNEPLIRGRQLEVELRLPKDEESNRAAAGEDMLCYSIIANLIRNAVEASALEGRLIITMRIAEAVELEITNTGVVPEKIVPHFFDKYVTCGKSQGTGLGTYSAKLLTELQQGSIVLDTSRSDYTTIRVVLPLWQE